MIKSSGNRTLFRRRHMNYDESCIFCKIGRKEIVSAIVYEDSEVLAFLDINPVSKGHTLIITKEHFKNFNEVPKNLLNKVMQVAQTLSQASILELGATGVNILTNINRSAGQEIMHFHVHVIPRYDSTDGFNLSMKPLAIETQDLSNIATLIKKGL